MIARIGEETGGELPLEPDQPATRRHLFGWLFRVGVAWRSLASSGRTSRRHRTHSATRALSRLPSRSRRDAAKTCISWYAAAAGSVRRAHPIHRHLLVIRQNGT